MNEDKREKIVFRLYVLNLFLNVIFYFIVDSLNNINAILVFNLLTIGSIELFVGKDDNGVGFHIVRGFFAFLFTFIIALITCAILNALITGIFKEKGERFIESLNIYPADKKEFYFSGERGIRTPGTVARTAVFETAPLNHSGTSPCNTYYFDAFLASSFILSRNVSSTLK